MANYWVYVVELSDRAAQRLLPDKPVVYVGQTALDPDERLRKHWRGERSSSWVRNYGLRLLPELSARVPRLSSRAEALEWEARLAQELDAQGYVVKGGH